MKKITFLMMAVMLSLGAVMATDFYDGIFQFRTGGLNGGVLVMGPSSSFAGGAFDIPTTATDATPTTYNVTEVRNYFLQHFTGSKPTSITVPEGVFNIGIGDGGSFDTSNTGNGAEVTSITLPSSLTNTTFSNFSFRAYPKLTSFTIKMATPPTVGTNTFYNVDMSKLTIHIPAGKAADYSTAGWNSTTWPGVTIVEDVATSVKEVSASDVKVMAMSGNSFAIAGLKGAATVRVMNLAGKLVAQFSNVSNKQTLSSSLLNKGIYIVSVSEGVNSSNIKLVLN